MKCCMFCSGTPVLNLILAKLRFSGIHKELARGEIEHVLAHCPEQAYVTLSERCTYDCTFCSVPKLQGKIKTLKEVINIVEQAKKTGLMKAIAITSGVAKSPEDEIERVVEVVKALKKYNVPIGVAVYPTINSTELLNEAGAVELKYNVETMDREILDKYGLRVDVSQTMCLTCTGCDITPYRDI